MNSRHLLPATVVLLLAAAVPLLWLRWSPLDANDVGAGEGYYGIQARNLLENRQWWSPSLAPHGPPGFKPPLYPALLAASIARLGPTPGALRWPSVLAAALTAVAVAAVAARAAGPWAGPAAAALFLTLPWVADSSRFAAAVIVLTAFGAGAIALVADRTPSTARAAWAGLLLGLAFQCKLWMAGLVAAPALAALLPPRGARARALLAMIVVATAVGALHLAGVAAFEPGSLHEWLGYYFRRHLLDRIAATGFEHARTLPPGWYWAMIADAWVLALPLVALGVERAMARFREPAPRAALVWAVLGLVALSGFALKLGNYLYALMPAFAVLAAMGAAALASGAARATPLAAAFALAGSPWVARALGDEAPPLWAWAGAWLAFAAALALARRPGWARSAALALVALAAAGGLVRQSQRLPPRYHDPGYRAVVAAMGPLLAGASPRDTSYRAPDAPAFGYYLMRPGTYWWLADEVEPHERVARLGADTSLRVFVIDPSRRLYGGWPDSLTLEWLEGSTRELTGEIERRAGRRIAVRVFARQDGSR